VLYPAKAGIALLRKIARAGIRKFCSQRQVVYLPAHDPKSAERLRESRAVGAPVPVRELEPVASGGAIS
jgi:hypothetical protein